jgi:hypothetical protein
MAKALNEEGLLMAQRHPRQLLVGLFEQRRELLLRAGLCRVPQRGFHFPPEMRIAAQSPLPRLVLEETCQCSRPLHTFSPRLIDSGSRLSMLRVIAL